MTREPNQDELVCEFFQDLKTGFFIEVGANDPRGGSQTWALEQKGWRGILVEPQRKFFQALQAARPASRVICAACTTPEKRGQLTLYVPTQMNGFATLQRNIDDLDVKYDTSETVDAKTLDDLLAETGHNNRIDFVSIDTEGTEIDVLRGFDLKKYKPRLILVEDKGRSLDKHRYLVQHGYKLVKRTELNNWYVPASSNFTMTNFFERLRLYRKVFLGYPFRKFRHWRHTRRDKK
jgi:FkbM family methyltransferase